MILSESDLVAAITRDRAAGKRIAFAAMSFDLLKAGDVRLLQAAAATGIAWTTSPSAPSLTMRMRVT